MGDKLANGHLSNEEVEAHHVIGGLAGRWVGLAERGRRSLLCERILTAAVDVGRLKRNLFDGWLGLRGHASEESTYVGIHRGSGRNHCRLISL